MAAYKVKTRRRRKAASGRRPPGQTQALWLKIGWGALVGLLFISFVVWAYFFSYNVQEHCEEGLNTQNVRVAFNMPAFFSVGDDTEFWVTVVNERSAAADIVVELRYAGTSLLCSDDDQSHRASFGSIEPQERASRKMVISLPLCLEHFVFYNWPGDRVEFEAWLIVGSQRPERIDTISLPVIPVPRARTLGKWAGGWLAGLAIWTGKELWDRIKKMAEPPIPQKAVSQGRRRP